MPVTKNNRVNDYLEEVKETMNADADAASRFMIAVSVGITVFGSQAIGFFVGGVKGGIHAYKHRENVLYGLSTGAKQGQSAWAESAEKNRAIPEVGGGVVGGFVGAVAGSVHGSLNFFKNKCTRTRPQTNIHAHHNFIELKDEPEATAPVTKRLL